MELKLYDTYERKLRPSEPLEPGKAGLYACGPTVYDYAHIGNLRTYLFGDILRRVLALNGYDVTHVLCITDVGHLTSDADTGQDKMEKGSRRTSQSAWDIAEFYTRAFQQDLAQLHIQAPCVWARATEHIQEQIAFIADIARNGFTYRTEDGIYFDTQRLQRYGHLARLNIAGQQSGHRVDIGGKRSATDFALWKFSGAEQRQMEWDSPWGVASPAGTSSAPPCPPATWARCLTFTSAEKTTSRSTTPTRSRSTRPATTIRRRATGCTAPS
jgi:cysteinyl-tRNA synthetase